MNKKLIYAFIIIIFFLLSMSLMSCATLPKADAEKICVNYEKCIINSGGEITEQQHTECVAMTKENGELQDAAFMSCAGLKPCQFSVCMRMHFEARKNARKMITD